MLSGRVVLFGFEENKIKDILKNENVEKLILITLKNHTRTINLLKKHKTLQIIF